MPARRGEPGTSQYIAIIVGPSAEHRTLFSLSGNLHSTDTGFLFVIIGIIPAIKHLTVSSLFICIVFW